MLVSSEIRVTSSLAAHYSTKRYTITALHSGILCNGTGDYKKLFITLSSSVKGLGKQARDTPGCLCGRARTQSAAKLQSDMCTELIKGFRRCGAHANRTRSEQKAQRSFTRVLLAAPRIPLTFAQFPVRTPLARPPHVPGQDKSIIMRGGGVLQHAVHGKDEKESSASQGDGALGYP